MQAITKNWNTDENYWQINPIMKTISQFNKLYTSDKSYLLVPSQIHMF